jgi:PBP1b-binding outer membrane lipoprotein LpoB
MKKFLIFLFALVISGCSGDPKTPSDLIKKAYSEVCTKKDLVVLANYMLPGNAQAYRAGAQLSKTMSNALGVNLSSQIVSMCKEPIKIISEQLNGDRALVLTSYKTRDVLIKVDNKWYITLQ